MELDGLGAQLGDGGGVHVRVDVGLHDGQGELVSQGLDGAAERGGLAGARGAHEVEQELAALLEAGAQGVGLPVVVGKDRLLDLEDLVLVHVATA